MQLPNTPLGKGSKTGVTKQIRKGEGGYPLPFLTSYRSLKSVENLPKTVVLSKKELFRKGISDNFLGKSLP